MSRRVALAGLALGALTACGEPEPQPSAPGPPAVPPPPGPAPLTDPVTVQREHSAARGREVDLVLIVPEGVAAAGLPVCLALHGRGASARWFLGLGLPAMLTEVVRSGLPPFAVVAPDGDHYWVDGKRGDDPQRMLSEEVPRWVAGRGLRAPSAALGISMGAFGALRYARDHRDLRAVAACSPALFTSWGDARSRNVFRDRQHWESHEPLRHVDELRPVPVGVWCGTADPFVSAARRFVQAAQPAVAELSPGGHTDRYWKSVLPAILRFAGERLR
ncbi:esterase [Amycolatopsis suaedae]|uniref:Esterase n=1 Tax=Amycolatopsis suaedae TaxID=2510978 RepID=A0A4Q7J1S7_9PSEU|nr:esterase [Amycolatopsis suaedae]